MYEHGTLRVWLPDGYGAAIAVILFAIMLIFISGFIWKMVARRKGPCEMFPRTHRTHGAGADRFYKVALPIALFLSGCCRFSQWR
jgi:hypothetical protein